MQAYFVKEKERIVLILPDTLTLLNQHMYPHSYLERHTVNQSEDLHL